MIHRLHRCFGKVTGEQVRLLRDMTGAPLLQCKTVLTECDGDIDKAKGILREKNLIFADKKVGVNASAGVDQLMTQLWGFLLTPDRKRGVLVNLNAETDFVSKGDAFKGFLSNTLKLLLEKDVEANFAKGDSHLEGLLKDIKYDSLNTLEEERKILTAKTKENIEFGQIRTIRGNLE